MNEIRPFVPRVIHSICRALRGLRREAGLSDHSQYSEEPPVSNEHQGIGWKNSSSFTRPSSAAASVPG